MIKTLVELAGALVSLGAEIRHYYPDPMSNDVFEITDDLRMIALGIVTAPSGEGRISPKVLDETKADLRKLRSHYGDQLLEERIALALHYVDELLAVLDQLPPPHPDGPYGIKRIVAETFAFLEAEFGLSPVPGKRRFSYVSDHIGIDMDLPWGDSHVHLWQPANPSDYVWLEDLMFPDTGRIDWLAIPSGETVGIPADVQDWFTFVADALRIHGRDVLAGRPGAWERLKAAATERYRLIDERNEREFAAEQDAEARGAG